MQEDRRINKTKQSLRNALVQLILEKHYDDISVQDIIDRANVGRSTFYSHFRDKEDLFRGDWERLLVSFVSEINAENIKQGKFFPITELFIHLKHFHPFYRALVRSGKTEKLFGIGQKYLTERIELQLKELLENEEIFDVPLPILANHLSSEVFSLLKWWLDQNMPYPPEEMNIFFHKIISTEFAKMRE